MRARDLGRASAERHCPSHRGAEGSDSRCERVDGAGSTRDWASAAARASSAACPAQTQRAPQTASERAFLAPARAARHEPSRPLTACCSRARACGRRSSCARGRKWRRTATRAAKLRRLRVSALASSQAPGNFSLQQPAAASERHRSLQTGGTGRCKQEAPAAASERHRLLQAGGTSRCKGQAIDSWVHNLPQNCGRRSGPLAKKHWMGYPGHLTALE